MILHRGRKDILLYKLITPLDNKQIKHRNGQISVYELRVRSHEVGVNIAGGADGLGPLCLYAIILAVILFGIFLIYLFYFRAYGLKRGKKHRCNYCGQLVEVISDCCRAPITEHFLIGVCHKCGKECKISCSVCRKPIAGQS